MALLLPCSQNGCCTYFNSSHHSSSQSYICICVCVCIYICIFLSSSLKVGWICWEISQWYPLSAGFCGFCFCFLIHSTGNPRASVVAQWNRIRLPMWETRVRSLGWKDPLEKEMATHSSIIAWEIPWTEKPSRLLVHGDAKESDTT